MSDSGNPPPDATPPPPTYPSAPPPAYGAPPPPPPPPPPYGANPYGAPDYGPPGYGAQTYGAPAYGAPAYGGPPGYPPGYGRPIVPYAHWGLRLGGYLLDSILLTPFSIVAAIASGFAQDPNTGDLNTAALAFTVIVYLAAFGFGIWNQILRQGRTGQSLGKQWVGIRLIREDNGQPLGGWLTFGRSLLHVLDALPCYLGFLWPLWDAKRQTFADKIVKSVVIRADLFPVAPAPQPQAPQVY